MKLSAAVLIAILGSTGCLNQRTRQDTNLNSAPTETPSLEEMISSFIPEQTAGGKTPEGKSCEVQHLAGFIVSVDVVESSETVLTPDNSRAFTYNDAKLTELKHAAGKALFVRASIAPGMQLESAHKSMLSIQRQQNGKISVEAGKWNGLPIFGRYKTLICIL